MPHYYFDIKDGHRLVDSSELNFKDDADAIANAEAIAIGVSLEKPAVDPERHVAVLQVAARLDLGSFVSLARPALVGCLAWHSSNCLNQRRANDIVPVQAIPVVCGWRTARPIGNSMQSKLLAISGSSIASSMRTATTEFPIFSIVIRSCSSVTCQCLAQRLMSGDWMWLRVGWTGVVIDIESAISMLKRNRVVLVPAIGKTPSASLHAPCSPAQLPQFAEVGVGLASACLICRNPSVLPPQCELYCSDSAWIAY
jgi:hypothetical protein